MRNTLTFGNINSANYGVYISGSGRYNFPERDLSYVAIPGRNGDLIIDNGRWKNIAVSYPAFIAGDNLESFDPFRQRLMAESNKGYQILADTYDPTTFRKGVFAGGVDIEATDNLKAFEFDLTFQCAPQRYLLSGIESMIFAAPGEIVNPTLFNAEPIIVVEGYGRFTLNAKEYQVIDAFPEVVIDSQEKDCYTPDGFSATEIVSFMSDTEFPTLTPGTNTLSAIPNTITKIEIIPNWYKL